ncbi:MAG: hypothetical protein IJU69_01560 [Bacteroidales bacterium]|nr:hypothetical protein [Bacteroidales bacterium]
MTRRYSILSLLVSCAFVAGALATSCAGEMIEPGDGIDLFANNLNGVMLYEGSAIKESLAIDTWREMMPRNMEADTLVVRLFPKKGSSAGYTDEERLYMESIYPTITQYGLTAMKAHDDLRFNPGLTLAAVGSGASVTADITIRGREPGANLGDLFTLYAISIDNAFRYRYPGFRVNRDYLSDKNSETFDAYFAEGMTFPGLGSGSCICFAIPVYPELGEGGFTLAFNIPVEYSDGVDFGPDGSPREGAAVKKITVSASVPVRNPSYLNAFPFFPGASNGTNMIIMD